MHSRYFDPFLKLFQSDNLEISACAIIDGDQSEVEESDSETTAIENAKGLEVKGRVEVFSGTNTLEVDIFPTSDINPDYLKACFLNLGHSTSYNNLMSSERKNWKSELIKRVDGTVKKGRFAQELALLIDENFVVPEYINKALCFISQQKGIKFPC